MTVSRLMGSTNDFVVQSKPSRFRRILAIALSLIGTGLGQVVMGYPRRGATWCAGSLIAYVAFMGSIVGGSIGLTWLSFVLIVGLRLAATVNTALVPVSAMPPRKSFLTFAVVGIYVVGVIAGVIGTRFGRSFKIPTPSMYPSLEIGDQFVSSLILDKLERGRVIVFRYPPDPTKSYVQRIIGLPGDTVEIREGNLVLNGKVIDKLPLHDRCSTSGMRCSVWQESLDGNAYKIAVVERVPVADPASRDFGPVTVPGGQLFVLGDNRDNSADSRYWGYVPMELVQASPRFIFWSFGDEGMRLDRIGRVVK